MKSTGVVRRIDDLGRIVIPKEIRRTLRIREGESLEIYTEGELIMLKKYSPMEDLSEISSELVNTISQFLSNHMMIADRDKIIAVTGTQKNHYLNKSISGFLEEKMNDRETIIEKESSDVEFVNGVKEKCSYVICPIIANGDAIGLVSIYSSEKEVTDLEIKLASIVANFLGKHIEE